MQPDERAFFINIFRQIHEKALEESYNGANADSLQENLIAIAKLALKAIATIQP